MRAWRWLVAVAFCTLVASSVARGDCPLAKALEDARARHKVVAAAAGKARLSDALELKVALLVGSTFLKDPGANWIDALRTLQPELTVDEWAALGAYLVADAAYDASAASLKAAEAAYFDEMTRAAAAVKAAEAAYAEEVKFLDAERAAIRSLTIDSAEYLDRAAALADRLKKSYAKVNADLAPFVDCSSAAEAFVADKDKRLKKIAALEAEIARRRGVRTGDPSVDTASTSGTGSTTPPPPAGDATLADPNAPALGATWRMAGPPEVSTAHGVIQSATASRVTIEFKLEDGTLVTGFVSCDKPPPDVVREGQRIDLAATAGGDPRAVASGGFWLDQVAHGGLLKGSYASCSTIPNYDSARGGDCSRAAVSFYFSPYHSATESVIVFSGGKFNGDEAKVVWRYRKE